MILIPQNRRIRDIVSRMAINTNDDVARRVRALAAERMLRASRIARHLKVSDMAISRRMKGTVAFSPEQLIKLAELFDVPVEAFFSEGRVPEIAAI